METLKNAPERSSSFKVAAVELAGVVAAYVLIVFVLCPGNSLIGFPVHHDDFLILAFDGPAFFAHAYPTRPVSYAGIALLGNAALPVYYLSLHVLVILYAFLSLTLLRKLLGGRPMPVLFAILVGAAALSFECVVEYSKYTGLITSLLSGVFSVGAMSLMAAERTGSKGRAALRGPVMAAIWALCALSFWSKEDFILPAIFLAMYLACEARWAPGAERSRQVQWFALATGVILLGILVAVYNGLGKSVLTHANAGPYLADFSPLSVFHVGVAYLFMSPVASIAAALQASMFIWNLLAPAPVRWTRLLLIQVLIVLLVLPYCVLPKHTALYYDFNWTVWQIGAALILLWSVSDRSAVRWALAAIAILCVALGGPGRRNIAEWYRNSGRVDRNIVATLRTNAEALRPYRAVVIEGAPVPGPFFASTGRFLSVRYGLDHDWIVRVPKNGEYYRTTLQSLGTTVQGRVRTVAMEDEPRPVGVPVLSLAPDGTGTIVSPAFPIKESDRVRVAVMQPDTTVAGKKFQVQPNGQSAIALQGTNFQRGATIVFDGRNLETAFGNPEFITALVPDDMISRAGDKKVHALNPDGDISNELHFHVTSSAKDK
jgi:hypothetical protein